MNWFDSWALTLVVFIPAVGAIITMLIPREEEEAIKWTALLTTLATLGFTFLGEGLRDYLDPRLQLRRPA